MTTIALVDTAGGSLFTVPDADWAAIDQRVESAINLSPIADQVTQYLPQFKTLVEACRRWRSSTFPQIGSSAQSLSNYCDRALPTFQSVQQALSGPLTPEVQRQVVDALTSLSQWTMPLNDKFHTVSAEVADFYEINRAVDAQVDQYVQRLGTDWRSILPETTRVDDAAGRVRGVWQALSADLNSLVSEPIDVTDGFIASLQIESALLGWTDLRSEAQAFLGRHSTVLA